MNKRVLLVGDGAVATGFARMNHAYVDGLRRAGWDVHMLAINYYGDPHGYDFPIYPCYGRLGGDGFGVKRTPELLERIRPDVLCVTNDPWNLPAYMKRAGNTPVVASLAVDGKNCRGLGLNGLAMAVFWTQFGEREAKEGGYSGQTRVVPLGVDLDVYKPQDKIAARRALGLSPAMDKAFIVGVVGRNQPRKRLDLAMMYFAEWIKSRHIDDAYLFLHVAPTGEDAYDLDQLGTYLKISHRIIAPKMSRAQIGEGVPEVSLARVYSTFDVMLTTTQGEGWGLTHMEGMACGVPNICPDWAALAEWPAGAALRVPCTSFACTINGINAIGGIADEKATVQALQRMYSNPALRADYSARGLKRVADPAFRWDNIGAQFAEAVEAALMPQTFLQPGQSESDLAEAMAGGA